MREGGRERERPVSYNYVPTHVVTLTQVGTGVYLGQTYRGHPFQVLAWVRKFSLVSTGDEIWVRKFSLVSTGDEISLLIIIQSLYVHKNFWY